MSEDYKYISLDSRETPKNVTNVRIPLRGLDLNKKED